MEWKCCLLVRVQKNQGLGCLDCRDESIKKMLFWFNQPQQQSTLGLGSSLFTNQPAQQQNGQTQNASMQPTGAYFDSQCGVQLVTDCMHCALYLCATEQAVDALQDVGLPELMVFNQQTCSLALHARPQQQTLQVSFDPQSQVKESNTDSSIPRDAIGLESHHSLVVLTLMF